jgi:hypothetical protein
MIDRLECIASTPIAESYFKTKRLETNMLYEGLGVRFYKRWMPTTGDIAVRTKWHPCYKLNSLLTSRNAAGLHRLIQDTKIVELVHLVGLTIFGGIMARDIHSQSWGWLAFDTLINIGLNIYPIMVQRYNRNRVNRVLDRMQRIRVTINP